MRHDKKNITSMATGMVIGAALVSEAAAGIVAEPTWQKIYVDGQQVSMTAYNIAGSNYATNALEHGMDIKTLSTIIGHVTSATTLNVYAHVTDTMRENAAASIDRGIAGIEPPRRPSSPAKPKVVKTDFQAVKGKYRKPGTGCVSQIGEHLWEGRYSPKINGKRMARNVYAHTEAECEKKLAHMIREMKAEIATEKERRKQAELTG